MDYHITDNPSFLYILSLSNFNQLRYLKINLKSRKSRYNTSHQHLCPYLNTHQPVFSKLRF